MITCTLKIPRSGDALISLISYNVAVSCKGRLITEVNPNEECMVTAAFVRIDGFYIC